MDGTVGIDALFELRCGCVLDGCSDSSPGRAIFGPHSWWTDQGLEPPAAEPADWVLMCTETPGHGWQEVVSAVKI